MSATAAEDRRVPDVRDGHTSNGGDVTVSLSREFVEAVAVRVAELLAARDRGAAEPWIGVEMAAEHLACGKARVYALVSAGRIPFAKDGSRVLFRRSDLDVWLAAGGGVRP